MKKRVILEVLYFCLVIFNINAMELGQPSKKNLSIITQYYSQWGLYCQYCKKEVDIIDTKIITLLQNKAGFNLLDKIREKHIEWHLNKHEDFRQEYKNPKFLYGIDPQEKCFLERIPAKDGFGFNYNLFDCCTTQCNICGEIKENRIFEFTSLDLENPQSIFYLNKHVEPYVKKFGELHAQKHSLTFITADKTVKNTKETSNE